MDADRARGRDTPERGGTESSPSTVGRQETNRYRVMVRKEPYAVYIQRLAASFLGCGLGTLAVTLAVALLRSREVPNFGLFTLEILAFAVAGAVIGLGFGMSGWPESLEDLGHAKLVEEETLSEEPWSVSARKDRRRLWVITAGALLFILIAALWALHEPQHDGAYYYWPVWAGAFALAFAAGYLDEARRRREVERQRGLVYYYDAPEDRWVAIRVRGKGATAAPPQRQ